MTTQQLLDVLRDVEPGPERAAIVEELAPDVVPLGRTTAGHQTWPAKGVIRRIVRARGGNFVMQHRVVSIGKQSWDYAINQRSKFRRNDAWLMQARRRGLIV